MVSKALVHAREKTTPESLFNADDQAQKVRNAWQGSVAQLLRAGELLVEAKASIPHGRFEEWLRSIPFQKRTAQRLMAISSYAPFRKHIASLPAMWTTLFELTHLSEEAFEASVTSGKVHPDMKRQIAVRLSHDEARQATQKDEIRCEPPPEHRIINALLKLSAAIRENQNDNLIEIIREHERSDALLDNITYVLAWLQSVIRSLEDHRIHASGSGQKIRKLPKPRSS